MPETPEFPAPVTLNYVQVLHQHLSRVHLPHSSHAPVCTFSLERLLKCDLLAEVGLANEVHICRLVNTHTCMQVPLQCRTELGWEEKESGPQLEPGATFPTLQKVPSFLIQTRPSNLLQNYVYQDRMIEPILFNRFLGWFITLKYLIHGIWTSICTLVLGPVTFRGGRGP